MTAMHPTGMNESVTFECVGWRRAKVKNLGVFIQWPFQEFEEFRVVLELLRCSPIFAGAPEQCTRRVQAHGRVEVDQGGRPVAGQTGVLRYGWINAFECHSSVSSR